MLFLKRPKVTFIMCTLRGTYLGEVLDSIFGQTLTEWEMLVFNTDEKRKLEIMDKRVKVFNVDNDIGKWVVEGGKMATTNIIMNQADDDPNFPERAEMGYKYINKKGADIFTCGSIQRVPGTKQIGVYLPKPFNYEFHRLGSQGTGASMAFGAYNKNTCPKFRTEFPLLSDYVFLTDSYFMGCKFMSTVTPLGIRYLHPEALSQGSKEPEKQKEIKRIRKLFDDERILSERRIVK